MTSIKVKFRPSTVAAKDGSVYYQIIHERKVRQLQSGYSLSPEEWDERRSRPVAVSATDRSVRTARIGEGIRRDVGRLTRICRELERRGVVYTVDDIVEEFCDFMAHYSIVVYMGRLIAELRRHNRLRTAETYKATLSSFRKFLVDEIGSAEDFMLDALTSEVVELYEVYMRGRGNRPNTTSFYMRILRAVYNRAVDSGAIEQCNPFRRVYTGVEKTVKRALPLKVMKRIKALDLSPTPHADYARDMFLMSFYLRGMSFIDMAFLRKEDLASGYLSYRRHKTGQALRIEWTREMQALLDKYPKNPTRYLLPILTKEGVKERYAYRNAGHYINRHLKAIAQLVGVSMPLTLYCARHTWASAAKTKGVPVSVISEGMGHDSEATTRIYLASLDTCAVDRANELILRSI